MMVHRNAEIYCRAERKEHDDTLLAVPGGTKPSNHQYQLSTCSEISGGAFTFACTHWKGVTGMVAEFWEDFGIVVCGPSA